MSLTFLTVALCYLAGITQNYAIELTSAVIYDKLTEKELESLIASCLNEAIENKSELLNRCASSARLGDSVPQAYVDEAKLSEYLRQNSVIEPLLTEVGSASPWRPYLSPFADIIYIPGFDLSESVRLDLVQGVLEEASKLFNSRLPHAQPALDQVMLEYHKSHRADHQQMLTKLESISSTIETSLLPPRTEEQGRRAVLSDEWSNPFSVVAADDLDLTNPEHVRQIRELFIARYTDLPTTRKRFNTIIEGQRGTGKTMIMKHLAFETQVLEWIEKLGRQEKDFLTAPDNFIGVYTKLGQGVFDKSDFEAIAEQSRRERIFEHRLVLQLLYDVLGTMRSVYRLSPPGADQVRRMRGALQALLRIDGTLDAGANHEEIIRFSQDHISFRLIPEVDEYLGSVSPGGASECDFTPRLTLSSQLLPFLDVLRDSCSATVPFFLMLDDFDVLEPYQQERVFKTASMREFNTACFKFGVMVLGQKTSLSGSGRTFRFGDDYDLIDLDWTQGGLQANYKTSVLEIAQARLRQSQWGSDLSALLPEWRRGGEILQEVRAQMDSEWEAAEKKPTQSKSDYFSKYGNARFFRLLRERKIRMRYAGLEYVTMISSGIYRQFLEACKLIFDRAHDGGWTPDQGEVKSETQDKALRAYSEEMLQQFSRTSGDAQALLSGDIEVTSQHMISLIESLCDVFYSRLHAPNHGEPEIICIAIRDDLNQCPEANTFLRIAVRESIFHRFQYPPKTPGGPNLPAFMLNRRLGPRRDLSIRRMQGRIEIDARDILLAVSDRKKFFNKIKEGAEGGTSAQQGLKF